MKFKEGQKIKALRDIADAITEGKIYKVLSVYETDMRITTNNGDGLVYKDSADFYFKILLDSKKDLNKYYNET